MPRKAKRVTITLSREQLAELRRDQHLILHDERQELSARANKLRWRQKADQAELARVLGLLKAERQAQGLSLADVQKKTGITRTALSRLENMAPTTSWPASMANRSVCRAS